MSFSITFKSMGRRPPTPCNDNIRYCPVCLNTQPNDCPGCKSEFFCS